MYKCEEYRVKIDIQLDNGIYTFENTSGSGKTRLAKELLLLEAYGKRVTSYTYNDMLRRRKIEEVLVPNKYDVILIDRYDLYMSEEINNLMDLCRKDTIILVDYKGNTGISEYEDFCTLKMTKTRIEVLG